jgi:hypothetical protein
MLAAGLVSTAWTRRFARERMVGSRARTGGRQR